jgi:uncharacterized protein GlcG (DUF336 family)
LRYRILDWFGLGCYDASILIVEVLISLTSNKGKDMKKITMAVSAAVLALASQGAMATCSDVSREALQDAVDNAAAGCIGESCGDDTGGYGLNMWVTMVDESGKVCYVVTTGDGGADGDEWLGSRVISAQKANTANAFSLNGYAISTANLYTPVQPGGSLYGLQHSNPVDASRAYGGNPAGNGTASDYLKNKRIGGVNVFGGGLALYEGGETKVGAIGVSGDTSCRDHAFAWLVRANLDMHPGGTGITTVNMNAGGGANTPAAVGTVGDEMIINGTGGWEAWEHAACPNTATGSLIGVIDMD